MKMQLLAKWAAFVVGLAGLAGIAFSQPSGGAGPQPVPNPWAVSGSAISYSQGGILAPVGVTGGSKGVGTINASGLYINGVAVASGSTIIDTAHGGLGGNNSSASGIPVFTSGVVSFNPVGAGVLSALSTNVSGTGSICLSSGSACSGNPGGSSNQVQYNNGGVFGGVGPGTTTTLLHGNASGPPSYGAVANADLVNSATTVNGQICTLGSTCTITASAGTITVGTTTVASGTSNRFLYDNAGVLGEAIIGSGLNFSAGTLTATGGISGSGTSPQITCWSGTTAIGNCADQNFAFLDANQSWTKSQRGTPGTCTLSTATCTPNFDNAQNISLTLSSACPCTFANPSTTPVAGQTGVLIIIQDSTGSRTITTWGSDYITPGGVGTLTLTSGVGNAIDLFSYYVIDSTHIVVTQGALNVIH